MWLWINAGWVAVDKVFDKTKIYILWCDVAVCGVDSGKVYVSWKSKIDFCSQKLWILDACDIRFLVWLWVFHRILLLKMTMPTFFSRTGSPSEVNLFLQKIVTFQKAACSYHNVLPVITIYSSTIGTTLYHSVISPLHYSQPKGITPTHNYNLIFVPNTTRDFLRKYEIADRVGSAELLCDAIACNLLITWCTRGQAKKRCRLCSPTAWILRAWFFKQNFSWKSTLSHCKSLAISTQGMTLWAQNIQVFAELKVPC